jgi:hypothetical protein
MRSLTLALTFAFTAPTAFALDVTAPQRYTCISGNCLNGIGMVKDHLQDLDIQGPWRGGQTIAGERYLVSHTYSKGKQYEQYYGSDGLLERGTQPLQLAAGRLAPAFTGTFAKIDHPFYRRRMSVPREGVYDNGAGIEYRGRFEYIPLKGHEAGADPVSQWNVIFYGEKVDVEDGERSEGMFTAISFGNGKLLFQPARADYLSLLQQQYQRDLNLAQDDFRKQENEAMWRAALSVVGEVAFVMAGAGGSGGGGNRNSFAVDLVTNLLNSAQNGEGDAGEKMIDGLSKTLFNRIGGNNGNLNQRLGDAVTRGLQKARDAEAARQR